MMSRCLFLAAKGLGDTYPNPLVGAVIVYEGKIIGEGWHKKAGQAHAEKEAIQSVDNQFLLNKSTLFVNLEPCSHFGKTPPCANLILEKGIPNVVIGTKDPHSVVAGNGIKKLKEGGCQVKVGVLEEECFQLNKRFFTFQNKKRPYIILKWAATKDNFIAPLIKKKKASYPVSNKKAHNLVHLWRSQEQSILVGVQTVLDDNPSLTTRHVYGKNPLRIVLDPNEKLAGDKKIKVVCESTLLFSKGKENSKENSYLENLMSYLYQNEIQSILIEGGLKTLQSFIDIALWDEIRQFRSTKILKEGVSAPRIKVSFENKYKIGDNELFIYKKR